MGDAVSMPSVRRARGYRLYDMKGRRYLDLYQDNGRAITGHRPGKTILDLKNLLSRGQIAAYPSAYTEQARKALLTLFRGAADARVYANEERAIAAAEAHTGRRLGPEDIIDPVLSGARAGPLAFWRPFLGTEEPEVPLLLPILPIASPPSAASLIFREPPRRMVPMSDTCSPVALLALKRSVFDLISHMESCDRSRWERFDAYTLWTRKGPYLTLTIQEGEFADLHAELQSHGLLLSPRFPGPSIVPGEFTPGELAYLSRRFSRG